MTTGIRLISFSLTQISTAKPSHSQQQKQQQQPLSKAYSRRNAILLFSVFSLIKPPTATAFSLGISGPKEWLRDQKKKASKFLLAPIDASRDSLLTASSILLRPGETDPESSTKDLAEVQRLLKAAARDCVLQDRNSFVAFQAQTGVEVCTFRLIVKNAASLLDDRNLVKLEAEAILGDLIRSFTFLNGVLNSSDLQLASDRQKVEEVLVDTISSLDKFEQGVKNCLDA